MHVYLSISLRDDFVVVCPPQDEPNLYDLARTPVAASPSKLSLSPARPATAAAQPLFPTTATASAYTDGAPKAGDRSAASPPPPARPLFASDVQRTAVATSTVAVSNVHGVSVSGTSVSGSSFSFGTSSGTGTGSGNGSVSSHGSGTVSSNGTGNVNGTGNGSNNSTGTGSGNGTGPLSVHELSLAAVRVATEEFARKERDFAQRFDAVAGERDQVCESLMRG